MHKEWIFSNLIGDNFFPERLGAKRVIYSASWKRPLITLLWDCLSSKPTWPCSAGFTYAETLFLRLREFIAKYPASWFYLKFPDDALLEFCYEKPAEASYTNVGILYTFENDPAEQSGSQLLCLLLEDRTGVIVFTKSDGLEISYYGSDAPFQFLSETLMLGQGAAEAPAAVPQQQ